MGTVEELTEGQRAELVADLGGLRRRLEATLAASREDTRPVDLDLPIGRLSRMDALQQQNLAQANRRSAEARLQQVRSALAAQDAGEYGDCRDCGDPIGYARLKARPETPFCRSCQAQRERLR